MKNYQYKTNKGNIVEIHKDETPYREFEYYINGVMVAKGKKKDIVKELKITRTALNIRLNNSKWGKVKKRHELILIER